MMPLWRCRRMPGSVSVRRVRYVVANLRFEVWAWCFGPETSRLRLAAWRTRALLPLLQELMLRDWAQAPQHAVSYSWIPWRRATPTTSFVR